MNFQKNSFSLSASVRLPLTFFPSPLNPDCILARSVGVARFFRQLTYSESQTIGKIIYFDKFNCLSRRRVLNFQKNSFSLSASVRLPLTFFPSPLNPDCILARSVGVARFIRQLPRSESQTIGKNNLF